MQNLANRYLWLFASLCAFFMAMSVDQAKSAAFHLVEYSPKHQGRANAGSVALATDPSAVQFNPAALPLVEGWQIYTGGHIVYVQSKATDTGSQNGGIGDVNGDPNGEKSVNDSNPYKLGLIPNMYMSYPIIDDKLTWGIGVTAPFGMAYEWDPKWFGRLDTVSSDLKTINLSNVIGYKINDYISIGGGVDVQYLDAELSFKSEDEDNYTEDVHNPPMAREVLSVLQADNIAIGFNVGLLLQPTHSTKIGLSYRSPIDHEVKDATIKVAGTLIYPAVSIAVGLPGFYNIGISQKLSDKLTVGIDWMYTEWSSFKNLDARDTSNQLLLNERTETRIVNYKDAHAFTIGFEYDYSDSWDFRAGFKYDQSPVRDKFRNAKTPDNDRYWLTAGFTYYIDEMLTVDLAYTHIFIEKASIERDTYVFKENYAQSPNFPFGFVDRGHEGLVKGDFESSADILSVGLNIKF